MTRTLNRNAYTADGKPKYLRIYDLGDYEAQEKRIAAGKLDHHALDRFTVVFTRLKGGYQQYLGMSERPFGPLGVCQHGEAPGWQPIDRPSYGHLGKKITFDDLNEDCQRAVMQDYEAFWGVWVPQEGQAA